MPCNVIPRRTLVWSLVWSLSATGCASSFQRTPPPAPVVVAPPAIPSKPAGIEPPPWGTYWRKLCDSRRSLRETLKLELPTPEICSTLGPPPAV